MIDYGRPHPIPRPVMAPCDAVKLKPHEDPLKGHDAPDHICITAPRYAYAAQTYRSMPEPSIEDVERVEAVKRAKAERKEADKQRAKAAREAAIIEGIARRKAEREAASIDRQRVKKAEKKAKPKTLAESVFDLRVALHLSHEQFATLVGCSKVTTYNWEKGQTKPSADNLRKMAELSLRIGGIS